MEGLLLVEGVSSGSQMGIQVSLILRRVLNGVASLPLEELSRLGISNAVGLGGGFIR